MAIDPLAIVPTIVNSGLAAAFRAQGDGIALAISHVAVGKGLPDGGGWKGYVPDRTLTALKSETSRVPLLSGSKLDGYGFRVQALVPPTTDGTETPVRELAFILETGEVLAIWSEVAAAPLTGRTPRADILLAFDLYLEQVPLSALTIRVTSPDIPDTAGVLAGLLSGEIRTFIADIAQERRQVARGIY